MNSKVVRLDFLNVNTEEEFHEQLKLVFGFPDFYGKNIHAFIDCLSSLRCPEDGMIDIVIQKHEYLLLEIKNLSHLKVNILQDFIKAIEIVNKREISIGELISIKLLLI